MYVAAVPTWNNPLTRDRLLKNLSVIIKDVGIDPKVNDPRVNAFIIYSLVAIDPDVDAYFMFETMLFPIRVEKMRLFVASCMYGLSKEIPAIVIPMSPADSICYTSGDHHVVGE